MKTNIKKTVAEGIDIKKAKVDFVYFATHCLIDARTGKPFKWNFAQIKLMRRLCAKTQKGE